MADRIEQITQDEKERVAFDLPYYGGFATYTVRVYMLRLAEPYTFEPDGFSVHRLENDHCIGSGDTKAEAISDSQCNLAKLAEYRSYLAGNTTRPYGPRVAAP